jgi:hypothetical protein
MALPIVINGVSTLVPGVYANLTIQNSLASVAPAGRSVMILGEAEKGMPGAEMDLSKNFFTSFDDLQEFYGAGPLVDAARQLFQNQPSRAFPGSVFRVYAYKTNSTTRAEKTISSPSGYGALAAAEYGEQGNNIQTQIKTAQAEVKPSKEFAFLPSPAARSFAVVVNGVKTGSLALSADDQADDFVTALGAISGLSVSGGAAVPLFDGSGPMTVDVTSSGDTLTISRVATAEIFNPDLAAGQIAYVNTGSAIAGGADENLGVYVITSVSSTSLSMKQLKHHNGTAEINPVAFDDLSGVSLLLTSISVHERVSLEVTATTATGASATLEILENSADKLGLGMLLRDEDFANIVAQSTASISQISATVPSAGKLAISLSLGSWSSTPKVGDLIKIERDSLLEGASEANVGLFVVEAASAKTMTIARLFSGMTTAAVTAVALNGDLAPLKHAPGFVSSAIAARRLDSDAERKVLVEAARISDGVQFPAISVGGTPVLEISYYNAAATAATISIDSQRKLTLDLTGSGLTDVTINTKKYSTLAELVIVLNTISGVSAKVSHPTFNQYPTSSLDMVSAVGCLSGSSTASFTAKIKKDYYDWKQLFADNAQLLSFVEGALVLKAGLPDAESVPSFLTGAVIGSTSNASVQAGLDSGLKVTVRHVVPLFSRDAIYDIADGLTDEGSSYSIDAINAALKAHITTASAPVMNKRRFGMASFYGSFEDSKIKSGELGNDRIQMCFQLHTAQDGEGNLVKQLPYIAACAVAAGRSQAVLGTSMLRKPFLLSSAEHYGLDSIYDESLLPDFDPEDRAELEEALAAGLLVFQARPGFGVQMISQDQSTFSAINNPKSWFLERVNVSVIGDEVIETLQSTLDNFIGERNSDVPDAVIEQAVKDVLRVFLVGSGNGALISAKILKVERLGNQCKVKLQIVPTETLEAVILDVEAARDIAA